jgi:hypothetical protein
VLGSGEDVCPRWRVELATELRGQEDQMIPDGGEQLPVSFVKHERQGV